MSLLFLFYLSSFESFCCVFVIFSLIDKSHFHNHITGVILKRALPLCASILNTGISAEGWMRLN